MFPSILEFARELRGALSAVALLAPASNSAPAIPPAPQAGLRAPASAGGTHRRPGAEHNLLYQRSLAAAQILAKRQANVRYLFFTSGDVAQREVSLTFDDGPDPVRTPRILDILRRYRVKATFFVLGEKAARHPEILQRILAEGHDIGSHGFHHYVLPSLTRAQIDEDIDRSLQVIEAATGLRTRWFRAPGCSYSAEAIEALREKDLVRVDTNLNSGDFLQPGAPDVMRRAAGRVRSGSIILLHDWCPATVRNLPWLLSDLSRRRYRVAPLLELMEHAQREEIAPPFTIISEGVTVEPPQTYAGDDRRARAWLAAAAARVLRSPSRAASFPAPRARAEPGVGGLPAARAADGGEPSAQRVERR